MASFCRSLLTAVSRSPAARTSRLSHKSLNQTIMSSFSSSRSFSSVSSRSIFTSFFASRSSRIRSSLAAMESLMPLHSAVASARLKSRIAVDSHCWSCLSEGFATPL